MTRAGQYTTKQGIVVEDELGFGFDGIVLATSRQSAIKVLRYEPLYQRERDVYLRLHARRAVQVRGFKIPRMLRADDELWVIEMTIVSPPFVLDFAGRISTSDPSIPRT